jgi:membrane protein implicated in regulation of membrane protease activity
MKKWNEYPAAFRTFTVMFAGWLIPVLTVIVTGAEMSKWYWPVQISVLLLFALISLVVGRTQDRRDAELKKLLHDIRQRAQYAEFHRKENV